MRLERTQDTELIKLAVTHPEVWPHVSEDGVQRSDWEPVIDERVYQLAIYDDEYCGCFILVPQSAVCWEVHTCILPGHRGEKAVEAANKCVEWMFENTECLTIVTKVPSYNKAAYRLAKSAAFTDIGVVESFWLKDGIVYGVNLLGVKKCR